MYNDCMYNVKHIAYTIFLWSRPLSIIMECHLKRYAFHLPTTLKLQLFDFFLNLTFILASQMITHYSATAMLILQLSLMFRSKRKISRPKIARKKKRIIIKTEDQKRGEPKRTIIHSPSHLNRSLNTFFKSFHHFPFQSQHPIYIILALKNVPVLENLNGPCVYGVSSRGHDIFTFILPTARREFSFEFERAVC